MTNDSRVRCMGNGMNGEMKINIYNRNNDNINLLLC